MRWVRFLEVRLGGGLIRMTVNLLAVASGFLVVALSAAAGVAADSNGEKMTICHMPHGDPSGARTLQVSRSSWSGHQRHGDHEGSCTDADRKARPPAPAPPPPPPPTRLALALDESDGELDGDASFRVLVLNRGSAQGDHVRVEGTLTGNGRWTLREDVPGCSLAGDRLSCDLGSMPAESGVRLRLAFDGHPEVCRQVGLDLRLTATNDASTGDDRVKDSVHVGACSPLDPPSAALGPAPVLGDGA